MGKKKEPKSKKSALEIRNEIKHYIRNERDTILLKWKLLHMHDMSVIVSFIKIIINLIHFHSIKWI
jgi:hypothetical protein